MASIHIKKMLKITIYQGNPNQNQKKMYLILATMAIIQKRQGITSVDEDLKQREHSCTVDGNINWCSLVENSKEIPQKN